MSRRAKSWGNVLIKKKKKSLCENLSTDLDSARNFALGTPNRFRCGKKIKKKNWQVATGVFRKFPVVQCDRPHNSRKLCDIYENLPYMAGNW